MNTINTMMRMMMTVTVMMMLIMSVCFDIESARPLSQDAVFGNTFDNVMKQILKKDPEEFFDYEVVAERWKAVEHIHADEKAKAAAALKVISGEEPAAMDTATPETGHTSVDMVSELRKPAVSFVHNSPQYWKALANLRVRSYVQLSPEPKTTQQVAKVAAEGNLKGLTGVEGKSCVLILMDADSLTDHARQVRRGPLPDDRVAKLVQGALSGRGAPQTGSNGEITMPLAQDILCFIDGRPSAPKPLYHTLCAVPNKTPVLKVVTIAFDDASMRARKKRVSSSGASYSRKAIMTLVSKTNLFPEIIPEKQFMEPYNGFNTSDVMGFVRAPAPSEVWQVARKAGPASQRSFGLASSLSQCQFGLASRRARSLGAR